MNAIRHENNDQRALTGNLNTNRFEDLTEGFDFDDRRLSFRIVNKKNMFVCMLGFLFPRPVPSTVPIFLMFGMEIYTS